MAFYQVVRDSVYQGEVQRLAWNKRGPLQHGDAARLATLRTMNTVARLRDVPAELE
jgi:hypothetical protein